MGLLRSTDTVPGIDQLEYRDSLYYGKYQYRCTFNLYGVQFLYRVSSEKDLTKKLTPNPKKKFAAWFCIPADKRDGVRQNFYELVAYLNWRKAHATGKKKAASIRAEGSKVSVFSNDLTLLQQMRPLISSKLKYVFTEVKTSQYAGVKYFVNEPKFKYRIYMKSKWVDENLAKDLRELFKRVDTLNPSKALQHWINPDKKKSWKKSWKNRYCSSSYSIDYNDESTLSYLALCHGDILGKRFKLEKHPELKK